MQLKNILITLSLKYVSKVTKAKINSKYKTTTNHQLYVLKIPFQSIFFLSSIISISIFFFSISIFSFSIIIPHFNYITKILKINKK